MRSSVANYPARCRSSEFPFFTWIICKSSWKGKRTQQEVFFQRVPSVNDTQAAFFLLTKGVAPQLRTSGCGRSGLETRRITSDTATQTCGRVSARSWASFIALATAHGLSTPTLAASRLGLASAVRVCAAAHWRRVGRIPSGWSNSGTLSLQG